jgi:hypothetical protein
LIDFNGDGLEDLFVTYGLLSVAHGGEAASYFWRRVADALGDPGRLAEGHRALAMLRSWMSKGGGWAGSEQAAVYLNLGGGQFCDVSMLGVGGAAAIGSVVAVDWDRDGDLDVWVNSGDATGPRLVRNGLRSAGRRVSLQLVGERCNRDAIGARIEAVIGGRTVMRTVAAGSGRLSQSTLRVLIGLGNADQIDKLSIVWPDARLADQPVVQTRYENLKAGHYTIRQGAASEEIAPEAAR